MHALAIFVDHGINNGSYTMMAKPMKTLEIHYPMIQFLIMYIIIWLCQLQIHEFDWLKSILKAV